MSEFLEIVKKADTGRVWRVLDEFMDALKERGRMCIMIWYTA